MLSATMAAVFRVLLALLSVAIAIPGVFTFHSLFLWKLTLAMGEYGHRIAIVPLLVLICSLMGTGWGTRLSAGLSLIALIVMLLPLGQAVRRANTLPSDLAKAFDHEPPSQTVFDPIALFVGQPPASTSPQILTVPRQDSPLRLFFYPSASGKKAPCIVTVHSGGWEKGSAEEFPAWNSYWTQRGYAVASVEYRLAPASHWPAPLDDVRDALAHLKSHAGELGIDPENFVLLGRSAGGQIATAAACTLKDPAIRGCISMYGPADMVFAWEHADPNDILDSPKLMRQYMGGTYPEQPDRYHSASALRLINKDSPPMLMIHGIRDVLVWELQSRRLAEELRRQEIPHYYLDLPWATHALDFPFNGPSSQLARYTIDTFLDGLFTSPSSAGR